MRCLSCETEIDPKWRHAIDANVCPFCGAELIEQHLKELLTSLADTMDKLQTYPEQLSDWLLSNHNYIKTDSPDLASHLPRDLAAELKKAKDEEDFQERKKKTIKVKTENGEEEQIAEQLQSDDQSSKFFERAGIVRTAPDGTKTSAKDKSEHVKKMLEEIKKSGSASLTNEAGSHSMISPEMLENADADAVAELESIISGGDEIYSSLSNRSAYNSDDDDIPASVLAMASRGKSGNNSKGLEDLQRMQQKMNSAKSGLSSGRGGFSRQG